MGIGGAFSGGLLSGLKDIGSEFLKQANAYANAGENTPRSLDTPNSNDPDKVGDYGLLGDYASKVDKSAQRSYVESGYISNVRPRFFEVLLQEPDLTVVIKKRMFTSLIDNYQHDFMDSAERNFVRASKRLLQNKCHVLSTYERLSKLEKVIQNKGVLDDFFTPLLVSGIEALESFGVNIVDPKTKGIIDRIRKLQTFSEPEIFTTWFVDPDVPMDLGEGIGTFSMTLISSVNTTVSTEFSGGTCTLKIEDPYHLMNINELDIDRAIADIYNPKQTSALFQFSEDELAKQNNDLKQSLNNERTLRGVPPIIWKINDNTVLNKRIRAFIDESGRELIFSFDPGFVGIGAKVQLDPSANTGLDGLNNSDEKKFEKITKNLYLILNLRRQKEKSFTDIVTGDNEKEIEYIRSKMRLQFANKNIIQVMDSVHIFMSSKTQVDNSIVGVDLRSVGAPGSNLLSMLNSTVENLEQSFNNVAGFFGGASAGKPTFTEIEKDAIVGPDFPTWLWVSMRNEFTRQAAGVHVFAGIVDSVNESYSGGKYDLTVSCKDHTAYFSMGQINVKPAAQVPERSIFDPLTPFDLEFDAATGFIVNDHPKLLPENERLLFSGISKFKNGSRFIGSPMTQFLYLVGSDDVQTSTSNNQMQRTFFDPDGFVYRWKSGIGTLTFLGSKHPINSFRQSTSPAMTKNAFAGQDLMNVLSLLVTGSPYNYNTFIASATKNAALSFNNNSQRDDLSNVDVSRQLYRNLISDLQIENQTWGNFVPFKKIVMSEQSLKFIISGQFSIQRSSAKLDKITRERAQLFDALAAADHVYADDPNIYELTLDGSTGTANIQFGREQAPEGSRSIPSANIAVDQIRELDEQIIQYQNQITQSLSTVNTNDGSLQIFGDDLSFSPDYDGFGNQIGEEEREKSRLQLRRKMKYLTQRRLWRTKANDDPNLFIVDDQYDKDYDIQAFEREIGGSIPTLKSSYQNVAEQIQTVKQILGMEVFANTQGHIEVRPPGYNKVPSSVFYRMISDGRRIYPKTLEVLFINQAEGLVDRLKIIEDEIRLRTIAINLSKDSDAEKFLSGHQLTNSFGGGETASYSFKFITDQDGMFGGKPFTIRALVAQDSPDARESQEYQSLKSVTTNIAGQIRQRGLFDSRSQLNAIFNPKRLVRPANENIYTAYEKVQNRLSQLKGQKVQSLDELLKGGGEFNVSRDPDKNEIKLLRTQSDILKVTKEISAYVSERQSVLKQLRNAFRNIEQGGLINNDDKERRNALFPSLQKKGSSSSVIEHLIEDEEEDDLGPGSGGRYIIKDNQIISMDIQERKPDFTVIEVSGVPAEGLIQPLGGEGAQIGFQGNLQTTAIAVDYDLWRMYGFQVGNSIKAPYISDPDAQAAPLAVWKLTEQRRKMISGSVTIAGNEYVQPGEVVYIEDRDLLFYVESVSHSFTFGSQFTTSLKLTYGHNPGEYFPTMLDIIGKGLFSKRNQANKIRHARHGYSNGDQPLGVLIVDPAIILGQNNGDIEELVCGRYGDANRATLTQIIYTLKGAQTPGNEEEAQIELRIYHNTKRGYAPDTGLMNRAKYVKSWMKYPTMKAFGKSNPGGDSLGFPARLNKAVGTGLGSVAGLFGANQQKGSLLPDDMLEGLQLEDINRAVQIKTIDVTSPSGPSPKAWLAAREAQSSSSDLLGNLDSITSGSPIQSSQSGSQQAAQGAAPSSGHQTSRSQLLASAEEKALYKTVIDVWVKFVPKPKTIEQTGTVDQASQGIQEIIDIENGLK